MKQTIGVLKKNEKELKIIHELIVSKYDENIIVKVYQEQSNDDNHKDNSETNENQLWILCNDDLIPFKSIEHLIIISQHKEIPISAILEIAQAYNISVDSLHQHSYYKLQYHLYNELNKIDSEKLKEVVIKLLFENNDVIRTDTDAMLFLDSITSSPHFNYEHVNLLIELCQTEIKKRKNSISNDEDTLLYEICASIIQSKLMNQENVSDSKEAQRYFDKIFEDCFRTIKKIDLEHIGFVCTLLQSPLLTENNYEKIIFKIKRMDEPVDFVLLEKALSNSYVSKQILFWMLNKPTINYTDILLNVSNLNEIQLGSLYQKYLFQNKVSNLNGNQLTMLSKHVFQNKVEDNEKFGDNTYEEFTARYHIAHSKQINDDYVHHSNPNIREFAALSGCLTEKQIDSLIMDNDRNVLVNLILSHILSEEQLDKLIERSTQVLDEEAIKDINYHIAQSPLISEKQLWNMVTSKSETIQIGAASSNSLNKEQLDTLLKSKFDDVRQKAKSSLIYALNYHTLDDLVGNKKYNKMNGLLLTRLIETLIPIE